MAYVTDPTASPQTGYYTKQQWLGLPAGKRGFQSYQRYRQWWNQVVAPRKAANQANQQPQLKTTVIPDKKTPVAGQPYAPLPTAKLPPELNPIAAAVLQKMATNQVQSQLDPQLEQIKKQFQELSTRTAGQFETQRKSGVADIQAAAGQYGATLAEIGKSVGTTYDEAIQQQGAIDQGIRSFLAGQGQQVTGDVAAQAQAAGAPQASLDAIAGAGTPGGVSGVGGLAQGAQQAAVGYGAATASRLAAERAAEVSFAQQQPGLAAALGLEDTTRFTRDIGTRQTDALAEIAANQTNALDKLESQVPGLIQQTYQGLLDRETQKAIARTGFQQTARQSEINRRQTNRQTTAQIRQNAAELKERIREFNLSGGSSGTTKKGYQFHIGRNGHMYVQDPNTGQWSDTGPADSPTGGGGAGGAGKTGVGTNFFNKVSQQALKIAKDMFVGGHHQEKTPNPKYIAGTGTPQFIFKTVKGNPRPNDEAYAAVTNYWVQQYPGKDAAWLAKNIASTLGAANYQKGVAVFKDPASVEKYYRLYQQSQKNKTQPGATQTTPQPTRKQIGGQPKTPGGVVEGGQKGVNVVAPGTTGKKPGKGQSKTASVLEGAGKFISPLGYIAMQKAIGAITGATAGSGSKKKADTLPPLPVKGTKQYAQAVAQRSKAAQEEVRQGLVGGAVNESSEHGLTGYVMTKYGLDASAARAIVRAAFAEYRRVP